MVWRFKTEQFSFEYIESEVDHPVLWENHCHGQFEMIAVAEGDINIMLEGKSYRVKENQVIIIPPLSYHSVIANEKGIYRRVTAAFDQRGIPEVLRSGFANGEVRAAFLTPVQMEELKTVCQQEDPIFYAPLAHSIMVRTFYEAQKTARSSAATETDKFLQKAIEYIDAHLQEKILLDDLAAYTSRSKSSFCHLFEARMNITPKQYILQKKLALASKLIDEGVPRTAAAMRVGYDNYSNFYRLYHKADKTQQK